VESTFSKHLQPIFFQVFEKPTFYKQPTDQAVVDANRIELNQILDVYEKHLATAKTDFLVSNEVTVADLFHVPTLVPVALRYIPDLLTAYPHVKAWVDRLAALPAWQEIQKQQQAVLAAFAKK